MPSGPNQIDMLMAVKRELDNNPMSMLAAQQELNRRRSEDDPPRRIPGIPDVKCPHNS